MWNPAGFSYGPIEVEVDTADPRFAEAGARLIAWLADTAVLDPTLWLLEEVGARLSARPPDIPVSEDFVAYVLTEGGDLPASLRWIAPEAVIRRLEEKRLLLSA